MTPEVVTNIILLFVTLWHLAVGSKYLFNLHEDYVKGIWVYGDELHSLQHFAIASIAIMLSLSMMVSSIFETQFPWQFIEHMAYNLACVLIVYPHLIYESKDEIKNPQ